MSDAPDYRSTVFLPRTDFPMKAGLAEAEPRWLARWKADGLHAKLRAARAGRERFILHDGPPYANGDLHMGHAMNKILKDLVVRTQTLLGRDAPYVPGWDCHGLPIEWKVEEAYRAKKRSKDEVPVAEFRAECRAFAAGWVEKQKAQFERLGVMGDWDDPYLTMDYAAEAAIVGELLKFAEGGQVYRGAKPVMWSPVERTALAEAEVEYEDIVSTQVDVAFEIVSAPNAPELVGAYAVVWTTTPWTLPVNQAIAFNPDVEYLWVGYRYANNTKTTGMVVIARDLEQQFIKRIGIGFAVAAGEVGPTRTLRWAGKGSALAGATARHPMHHLGGFYATPRPFLAGDFVTTDQGTGLVHMAPDHGEDDFELCKANGIDPVFAVEDDGKYRADWAWLGGQGSVIAPKLNAPDGPICSDLREAGALLAASADYRHSYPHSWRSKAKVIFRATPQWFIAMDRALPLVAPAPSTGLAGPPPRSGGDLGKKEDPPRNGEGDHAQHGGGAGATLRATALAAIAATRWVPAKGENRIRAMVEGRPDWLISRQRAWGVPITLFVNRATGEYLRDADVNARIVAAVSEGGADAWFAADPQALLGNRYSADEWERVRDILDVWFDSGSTHAFVTEARFGQVQADLYLEGSDQHRGWFQSSLLESCGTRGRAPYKAVLTHGFALDDQGRKMSKSVGNTTDPAEIARTSGADILRLWVATTDYSDDVRIGKEILAGTSDLYRKLRNTLRYLLGALDGWDEAERIAPAEMPELERWVLSCLVDLDKDLTKCIENFDFNDYTSKLVIFADFYLSSFYFDVRKDILYCEDVSSVKRRSYRTVLYHLFNALVRFLSPILVFTAEEAWTSRYGESADSVHLQTRINLDPSWRDLDLEKRWANILMMRRQLGSHLENARNAKIVRSFMEAQVSADLQSPTFVAALEGIDLAEVFLVSSFTIKPVPLPGNTVILAGFDNVVVEKTPHPKCARCWRHRQEVGTLTDPNLCDRCDAVLAHA